MPSANLSDWRVELHQYAMTLIENEKIEFSISGLWKFFGILQLD